METLRYVVEMDKIAHNIQLLRRRAGNRVVYAVLKANGYGLDCGRMAAVCSANGLGHFAVTSLADAKTVRDSGVDLQELLLLTSASPEQIPQLVELGVTFTVACLEDAVNLADYSVSAHIKVDTGFGRRGFHYRDDALPALYRQYNNIRFTGIYTHFAEGTDSKLTDVQFERFQALCQQLQQQGIDPGIRHCCSSGSAFGRDEWLLDGMRIGSGLLGRVAGADGLGLRRTGICQVRVEAVKSIPKGATVGYGNRFRAPGQMQVAICPIGTHHGFCVATCCGQQTAREGLLEQLRRFRAYLTGSNMPCVQIHGKRCPVLGCAGSEAVVVDVSAVDCQVGDLALVDINPMLLHGMPISFE